MAEVIGVVSSIIAIAEVAGQLAESIVKLKDYWDRVKDAPDDIRQLLHELDIYNDVLSYMQSDQTSTSISALKYKDSGATLAVGKSLILCRHAAAELSDLVDEFAGKLDGKASFRKMVGSIKFTLRKNEVKRQKKKMKNTLRLLSLAYQCHIGGMIYLQPEIIVQRLSSLPILSKTGAPEAQLQETDTLMTLEKSRLVDKNLGRKCQQRTLWPPWVRFLLGSFKYHEQCHRQNSRDGLDIQVQYTLPPWLCSMILDTRFQNLAGWQFNLRAYRRQPQNSEFFHFAATGDIKGLQRTLLQGKAFITDREAKHGQTALHLAAREGHLEACRFLLNEGADPLAYSDNNQTPLHTVTLWASYLTFHRQRPASEICRLLIEAGASDALIEDLSIFACRNMPKGLLRYLQQQVYPPYAMLPLEHRIGLVSGIKSGGWKNVPDLIRLTLGTSTLTTAIVTYKDLSGTTLLHHISNRWADGAHLYNSHGRPSDEGCDLVSWRNPFDPSNQNHPWRLLLAEVIRAGALVHAIDDHGRTPLCNLIRGVLRSYSDQTLQTFRSLNRTLNIWLLELQKAGVNLEQYGNLEMALSLREKVNQRDCRDSSTWKPFVLSKLVDFSFGPQPESWKFQFMEPTDKFAGQFWAMLEGHHCQENMISQYSSLKIPGSWPESIRKTDSDSDIEYDSDWQPTYTLRKDYGNDHDLDLEDLNGRAYNTNCTIKHRSTAEIYYPTLPFSLQIGPVFHTIIHEPDEILK